MIGLVIDRKWQFCIGAVILKGNQFSSAAPAKASLPAARRMAQYPGVWLLPDPL
jgi:hypothetical protein